MIRLDDILDLLRTYVSPDELEQIQRAYRLAKQACSNQSDGMCVDMSPALGAARILAQLEASVEGVVAVLLVNLEEGQCDLTAIYWRWANRFPSWWQRFVSCAGLPI